MVAKAKDVKQHQRKTQTMKNKLKKSIIALLFALALIVPMQTEAIAKNPPLDNSIKSATKEPFSKKELAMKFILAMVGVATSSIVLYVGLSVYNKLLNSQSKKVVGLQNLKKPENYKQGINKFLEITNWD